MNTTGLRVLVVGGVRRLGHELGLDLARHGARVCVSSRHTGQSLATAVESLEAAGADYATAVSGDVHTATGAADLIRAASSALGGLDAVVFAASGPFVPRAPEDIVEEEWDASVDTIAKGFFFTACAARDAFVAAVPPSGHNGGQTGVIVAITDLLGLQTWSRFAAHGAARAAQIHLVKQLARAWAADGVRVCGVAPGTVDLANDERRDAALRTAAMAAIPQLIDAADVGRAVRFCITTTALTGVNIPVDNGALLGT